MISLLRNINPIALLVLSLTTSATVMATEPVQNSDYRPQSQRMLAELIRENSADPRAKAILGVISRPSMGELTQAVNELESYIAASAQDNTAKMYYGYGLLFMASEFLNNKNYFKAAEFSKRGFFFIDEATESDLDNWRMRYLRARMDTFVPKVNGRCVIALKDIRYLQEQASIPEDLKPFITFMLARASATCDHPDQEQAAYQALESAGSQGQSLLAIKKEEKPFTRPEEISGVIQSLIGVHP
ncbi:hypothetical protein [Edaphovirga cremea]|uniref:hypothetical protein n=1 Tax=Edaphovirga cremea TaxID=2267246 RepID=UPI000DEFC4E4|nr:hypothetical protein [Edaphovirga cremea]